MSKHTDHAKNPTAIEVVEMVGKSKQNWEDAARQLVKRASKSYPHITGLGIQHSTAVVKDGKIVEYHIDDKLAYIADSNTMKV